MSDAIRCADACCMIDHPGPELLALLFIVGLGDSVRGDELTAMGEQRVCFRMDMPTDVFDVIGSLCLEQ